MMKKVISIFLVALVFSLHFAYAIETTEVEDTLYYVNENFNSDTNDDIKQKWVIDKREGDYDITYEEENNNGMLSVWCQSPTDYQKFPQLVKKFASSIDRGVILVKYRAKSSNKNGNCMINIANEDLQPAFQMVFRAAGTLTFNQYVVLNKFEEGKWYDIDIYIDLDKYLIDAYLDGDLVVAKGAFKTEGVNSLSNVNITGYYNTDEKAQIDIDDLSASDYTSIQVKEDEKKPQPYDKTIEMLEALSVLDERDVLEFNGASEITRGEFLSYLLGLSECKESDLAVYENVIFDDIAQDNRYLRIADWAYSRGIITLNAQKLFYPDLPIKKIDAMVMIERLAGYEIKANLLGGYPNSYLMIAKEIGLLNSNLNMDSNLSGEQMLYLFKDALDIEVLKPVTFGNRIQYQSMEGETLLKHFKGIKKVRGIVTGNNQTGIMNSSSAKRNALEIDKVAYMDNQNLYGKYIGYEVWAYIDVNKNDETVVYAVPTEKNKIFELGKKDMSEISLDGNNIKYSLKKGSKEYSLNVEDPFVIYNGRAYIGSLDTEILTINNGSITFVDNNNDGTYDVVVIDECEHIIFAGYDTINSIIYGTMNEKYILNDNYTAYRNNEIIDLEDLKYSDVISVKRTISDSDDVYSLNSIRNLIYGTISEISEDEIVISEKVYYLSAEYLKYNITPNVGFSGVFYLDNDGNILFFEENAVATGGKKTGYLLKGKYVLRNLQEQFQLAIVDFNSGYKKSVIRGKVTINDTTYRSVKITDKLTETGEDGGINQIIDYWENSKNEIVRIEVGNYTREVSNSTRNAYSGGMLLYNNAEKIVLTGKSTVFYAIPGLDENNTDDYCPIDKTRFYSGELLTISAYNLNEIGIADVVLVTERVNSFNVNDTRILIKGISKKLDSKGNEVKAVKAYSGGKNTEYIVSEGLNFPDFNFGTILSIKFNARDEISGYQIRLDMTGSSTEFTDGSYNDTQYCYGRIKNTTDEGLLLTVGGEQFPYVYNTQCKNYIVDVSKKKLYPVARSSIGAYKAEHQESTYIYSVGYRGGLNELYILIY